MSVNRKIARASIVLITISIFGHSLSLLKEMLVASYFGVSRQMDAYYAAITLPNLLTNILISTFIAAFIPVFVKYREQEQATSLMTVSIVVNYVLLLTSAISAFFFIFAPLLIRLCFHGFSPETAHLASNILRAVSVTVVFSSLAGIFSALLNSYESFKWPALLQVSVTVSTMAFLLLTARSLGVYSLAAGLAAGVAFQFAALVVFAYAKGYRYAASLERNSPALKEIFAGAAMLLLAVLSSQVNMLVDRVMASFLEVGSLAALGYADKLVQVPLIIFSGSISIAIFPYFSKQAAENKLVEMSESISKSVRMSAFIFIPLTVMAVILAEPVISLLFERGAFTHTATLLTSNIFVCYSFQILFFTVALILYRAILAMRDTAAFLKVALFSIILNIVLNFLFIRLIRPPAAGIALSTSLVQAVSCVILSVLLNKRNIILGWKYILNGLLKIVPAAAAAGAALILIYGWYIHHVTAHALVFNAVGIILGFAAGTAVFMAVSGILGLEEVSSCLKAVKEFDKMHQ